MKFVTLIALTAMIASQVEGMGGGAEASRERE